MQLCSFTPAASPSARAIRHVDFIDHPDKEFEESEMPKMFNDRTVSAIKDSVLRLDKIAKILRAKRSQGGSLQLDQPKLCFDLDESFGMPKGIAVYERKDANSLIEEFMLLANMAVAKKIAHTYPKIALLRRHPPPKQKMLRDILEQCEQIGFAVDGSSGASIARSLEKYAGNSALQRTIVQVLSHFLMKAMQLAVYFCTGSVKSESEYVHYALNVPYYTHFTSPIRRYPDVMVHRLLAAALGYAPVPNLTIKEVEERAIHCNDKKLAAKTVSEASAETFFGVFVKECGPLEECAVVLQVLDASFDVLIVKYGIVKRVYVNRLRMAREPRFIEGPCPSLTLYWDAHEGPTNAVTEQTIRMCTIVTVILSALSEPTKFQATIKPSSGEETHSLAESYDAVKC
ncbi:hypothetical protein AB6A40_001274 [Gnathostoma spinigerum]|uniref:RNB domain-containing protein n=1 Tax=Gnathostoma spinigerum TaxID=75299 RepID=A0ABD6EE14_9BILA